jgi:gamma-glutamyltranspeptidase/glutathione hydrolase
MVASSSTLAASAGVSVLQRGGNAFDAAIAVAGVEWIDLSAQCGLGGDVFTVFYDAKSDRVGAINGSGESARAASRAYYVDQGLSKMPLDGWHAAAVPGAPGAYAALNEAYGTMPMSELLAPAASYAEEGIIVSDGTHRFIAGAASTLAKYPYSARRYLPEGRAPNPGERWVLPELARTIRSYAEEGPDVFYRGEIADEIVRTSREGDGLFGAEEFEAQEADLYDPLHTTYRDFDVYTTAPPSQGVIVLEWLNLLEGYDLESLGFGSADALHLMVETKKLAFADRLAYCGDPRFVDNPLDELLSKTYAETCRASIDPAKANNEPLAGALPERGGNTSYFAVADAEGNVVSFIHSLSAAFGCCVVAGETGVMLNNRAGRGFTLEEGHPNVIEGGKKTMHTLNCYLLCRDGRPYAAVGTPGGDRQAQWDIQVISNLLDHGMDVQQAVEAPRWVSWPGTDPALIDNPLEFHYEDRFDAGVIGELESRGHRVKSMTEWGGGGALQVIARKEDGTLLGGCDPRSRGVALGW